MAKTKKEKEKDSIFFYTFVGNYVEVVGAFYNQNQEVPLSIQGYLLDQDDEYYFLGDHPHNITHAVKIESVRYIAIYSDDDQYKKVLVEMCPPETDEDIN